VDSSWQLVGRFLDSYLTVICSSLLAEILWTVVGQFVDIYSASFHTYLLGVRLIFHNLFSHLFARSEVVVLLPLFTPVLTGVRQCSFAVAASE
jgi:hypothetical protein